MDILIRKGRAIDLRARPNSVDSKGCFSKREKGKGGRGRKVGICHGQKFEEVSLSRGVDRHEAQGAGLGTEMESQGKYKFYFIWVETFPLACGCCHVSCTF